MKIFKVISFLLQCISSLLGLLVVIILVAVFLEVDLLEQYFYYFLGQLCLIN